MIFFSEYDGSSDWSFAACSGRDSQVIIGSTPRCHERVTASARNGPSQPWKYPATVGWAPTRAATSSNSDQLNGDWAV